MQRARRVPRLEADPGDIFAIGAGGVQRQLEAVHGHRVGFGYQSTDPHLHALHRGIDVARGAAKPGFLAEHVPWLECCSELNPHATRGQFAKQGEAELEEGLEPVGVERKACVLQRGEHIAEIDPVEEWQHESVVQRRTVADQATLPRSLPEMRNQTSHQKRLHQTHLLMRRHFKRPQFNESPPRRTRARLK